MNISDLELISGQAVRNVASRLGIRHADFVSVEELREQIKLKSPGEFSPLLESFLNTYWEWFDYHRRIEAAGKQGQLDRDESEQLARLVGRRNESRAALLARLG